jgi:hypothetical protein
LLILEISISPLLKILGLNRTRSKEMWYSACRSQNFLLDSHIYSWHLAPTTHNHRRRAWCNESSILHPRYYPSCSKAISSPNPAATTEIFVLAMPFPQSESQATKAISPTPPRIRLIPWDADSEEHIQRMIQQRRTCGWKQDAVRSWVPLQNRGDMALHWIVRPLPILNYNNATT